MLGGAYGHTEAISLKTVGAAASSSKAKTYDKAYHFLDCNLLAGFSRWCDGSSDLSVSDLGRWTSLFLSTSSFQERYHGTAWPCLSHSSCRKGPACLRHGRCPKRPGYIGAWGQGD